MLQLSLPLFKSPFSTDSIAILTWQGHFMMRSHDLSPKRNIHLSKLCCQMKDKGAVTGQVHGGFIIPQLSWRISERFHSLETNVPFRLFSNLKLKTALLQQPWFLDVTGLKFLLEKLHSFSKLFRLLFQFAMRLT